MLFGTRQRREIIAWVNGFSWCYRDSPLDGPGYGTTTCDRAPLSELLEVARPRRRARMIASHPGRR